jgi:predicted MPP superfamily phosphohydrolase
MGAPTGLLRGVVNDGVTANPIAEATIDCFLNGTIPYTQGVSLGNGSYQATLPPTHYGLEFSAEGYNDGDASATIALAGTTYVNAELFPTDWTPAQGDTLTVIMRPILTVPEIVLDGDAFVVEAIAPPLTEGWSAALRRGETRHDLAISGSVYDSDHERWFLNVSVPTGVAAEIYDLVVEAEGVIADTAAHAVAVRNSIDTSFYFVHITDTHLPTHLFYGDDGWGADTTEMDDLRAVISDINLTNPAFVLVTGDLINEGETEDLLGQRAFTKTQRLLETLDVPVFVVAGNHDVGGWDSTPVPDGTARRTWWKFFGWRYLAAPPPGDAVYTQNYSFDYGGAHFVGLEAYINYDDWRRQIYGWESFTDRQLEWLLDDLSLVDPASPRILFYHCDFDDELNLASLGVDCALWGHIHSNSGSIYNRPLDLATNNVCDGERWMRFVRIADGVTHASEPVSAGEDGQRLRVSFDPANDGTAARVTATVVNENPEAFEHALLKFCVPADSLPYGTSAGEITQTVVDGDVATCYVRFSIPFQNTTLVAIEPVAGTSPLPEGSVALLRQNHPNPTRGSTTIRFVLAFAADVTIDVFDVAGRRVRRLLREPAEAGEREVSWDLRNDSGDGVAPGVYFYRLNAGGESLTRKLVVVE